MADSPFRPEHFERVDESDDGAFYREPRLVAHIDDAARAALARFYGAHLPADGIVLDLMASCYSHLPEDARYRAVIGLGLNAVELDANAQLTAGIVHDVNRTPELPFKDAAFDAAIMTVSAQYLTRPIETFRSLARIIRPGGRLAVAYSNRMFPTKAVALWRAIGMADRGRLISIYCQEARDFHDIEIRDITPTPSQSDAIAVVTATRV
ncbi:MAG: methyltransferase domain-containing protein [Alphaproteobacteria bacterium]